jgi:hypothetical protein
MENMEYKIRLFADDCLLYRKLLNAKDIKKLQTDLDKLRDLGVENEMKINPNKNKEIIFTRALLKDPLNYSLRDQNIPEAKFCKYFGIIMRNDLSWAEHVHYMVRKAWRALHFVMRIVDRGDQNIKF